MTIKNKMMLVNESSIDKHEPSIDEIIVAIELSNMSEEIKKKITKTILMPLKLQNEKKELIKNMDLQEKATKDDENFTLTRNGSSYTIDQISNSIINKGCDINLLESLINMHNIDYILNEVIKKPEGEIYHSNNSIIINGKKYYMNVSYKYINGEIIYNFHLLFSEVFKSYMISGLETLLHLTGRRDNETKEHLIITSIIAKILALELRKREDFKEKIDDNFIDNIGYTMLLHDIGKIFIPDHILLKKGKLTAEEFEEMKLHTVEGGEIINFLIEKFGLIDVLDMAKIIATFHHEKYDGSGYPSGISGTDIPLAARIGAIIDVFDALMSERPYKKPYTPEETKIIMQKVRGTHFDPFILDVFFEIWDNVLGIRQVVINESLNNKVQK